MNRVQPLACYEIDELDDDLRDWKNDEEVEEKARLGPQVSSSLRSSINCRRRRRGMSVARSHGELQVHVDELDEVGHAAQRGDGDGEPAVDEEAEAAGADGEGIEEERVDDESRGAHEEEHAVPLLDRIKVVEERHGAPEASPVVAAGGRVGVGGGDEGLSGGHGYAVVEYEERRR